MALGRDPYGPTAEKYLDGAQKKRTRLLQDLRSAKDPQKQARQLGNAIKKAHDDAKGAVQFAQDYVRNTKHSRKENETAKRLLEEAVALQENLDDAKLLAEALQNPRSSDAPKKFSTVLKRRAGEQVIDEVTRQLAEGLLNVATGNAIPAITAVVVNMPSGAPKWLAGAGAEALAALGDRAQRRSARNRHNLDIDTGTCADFPCHACRHNRDHPERRPMTCQNLYR